MPWVHVKGYWLAEAGFAIGTPLEVEVSEGRLVISAAPSPPAPDRRPRRPCGRRLHGLINVSDLVYGKV
ncbi:type I toxin-antitoxin system SymE family toxin [Alcanivorax sp. IO_7]|nr:type I toxin-antitoxin system SymE family toxin [Alcanivorax sp. IO_7]